jgi:hypothetical protein
MGFTAASTVTTSFIAMVATLAYLPFRVVCVPTALVGRVAVWLADGYRTASQLERLLILPSWALFRGMFIFGWTLSHVLHWAARRSLGRPADLV